MAALDGTRYWVRRALSDPLVSLDQFSIYSSAASNGDTISSNMRTDNGFTVQITAVESDVYGGYTFDSDGVVTVVLQDSAGVAVNNKAITVLVTGIAKNRTVANMPKVTD